MIIEHDHLLRARLKLAAMVALNAETIEAMRARHVVHNT
jgi:hypothetical protein